MLQTTDINSENLPSTQQANNLSENIVTNAQLLIFQKTFQNKVDRLNNKKPSADIDNTFTMNPRTGKPFKRYFFSCGCFQHWRKNSPTKRRNIKMMRSSRTGWVVGMIIVFPIVRDWMGGQTYKLNY